ncbi:MAG: cob(I)yrinic acid a,c-diamide adenosyltransferase [Planctomycetia bacterium]|nr:cob(I)yrinic acid a,c-diamide adenosyltransferase [Planctomycetia bacterium]
MKIYTKTGDDGETGLFGGPRVPKDHLRIEAYGTVDELNSVVGLVRLHLRSSQALLVGLDANLERIQNELFDLGAALATPEPMKFGIAGITDDAITALELSIDRLELDLEPLRQFILPGGAPAAAYLHLARTVCRRAERLLVALARAADIAPNAVIYLNRLSDWLFVAARWVNKSEGQPDVPWLKERPTS